MPSLKYPLATRSWAQEDPSSIELRLPSGKIIASFPIAFVRDGGSNTWEFVLSVVDLLVERDPELPSIITDLDGAAVTLHDAPSAGSFLYRQLGPSHSFVPCSNSKHN
jgi:hypothetical protein